MGKRKRQTALSFSPLPSSSPATRGYNKQVQARAAAVTYSATPSPRKSRKLDRAAKDVLPTPSATLQDASSDLEPRSNSKRASSRLKQRQIDFSGVRDHSSFDEPLRLPSSSKPRSSNDAGLFSSSARKRKIRDLSSDDSDEDDAADVSVRRTRSSATSHNQAIEDDDEDEDDVVPQSAARRAQRTQRPIVLSDDEDEEEDEDDMPTTQGKQTRKSRARRSADDDFISSSPPRAVESDSDVMIVGGGDGDSDEDEDDDDEPITPNRRNVRPGRKLTQREQDDLNEDLDFLDRSSDEESLDRRPRNTQSEKKNARQQALERLKQKRSGQVEQEIIEVDSGDEEEEHEEPAPLSSRQMFNGTEEDEEFIDESDVENDTLGVPEDMPIEFTAYARMKPKELFKYVVEWMVQKRINPGFAMDDELYKLSFRKLDDEVKGLAGSKFKSSVWTQQFTSSLNSRPDADFRHIERGMGEDFLSDKCHACNRSGHPATFEVRFLGKPYHRDSLEDVDQDGDDDDDDSSSDEADDNAGDRVSYDANGGEVPPENHVYYVGKFCAANAETAHSLQHWRYHLYETVSVMLAKDGYDHPDKVIERDRMKTKKRGKLANKIVDQMEENNQLREIWRLFKGRIEDARNSKQAHFGNRGDSP